MGGRVVTGIGRDTRKAQALRNFPQPSSAQCPDLVAHAQRVEARDDGAHHRQAQRAHVGAGEVHQQDPVVDGPNPLAQDPQVGHGVAG